MRGTDIAEFYHQLAVLVDANLPLPASLQKLGEAFPNPAFRKVLNDVSARVDAGERFSEVLADYPTVFDAQHVQMIEAGESADSLDRMLYAIAEVAQFKASFALRMQQIATYPFIVLNLAFILLLGFAYYVAPSGSALIRGMNPDSEASLPLGLRATEIFSQFVHQAPFVAVGLCALSMGMCIWMLSGQRRAQRVLFRLSGVLPGMKKFSRMQDMVLICESLTALLPAGLSVPEACRRTATMLGQIDMIRALNNVAAAVERGERWESAIRSERSLDNLIALTVEHVPEESLAVELRGLADHFMSRVVYGTRSLMITWNAFLFVVMVFVVLGVIRIMLTPMYEMLQWFMW